MGEIVLLLLVGIIVVGPRNLPTMMRTAGQWVARLRRMSTELRSQSGIDDLLRREGLDEHLHELRSLSRLNMVDTLMAGATAAPMAQSAARTLSPYKPPVSAKAAEWTRDAPLREREYPLIGCDAYGALPDDATPYHPTHALHEPQPPPAEIATDAEGHPIEPPAVDAPAAEPGATVEPAVSAEPAVEPASPAEPAAAAEPAKTEATT